MVTLSSREAETYAAVEATKDIIYFRAILEELGFPQLQPTPFYVDHKSHYPGTTLLGQPQAMQTLPCPHPLHD